MQFFFLPANVGTDKDPLFTPRHLDLSLCLHGDLQTIHPRSHLAVFLVPSTWQALGNRLESIDCTLSKWVNVTQRKRCTCSGSILQTVSKIESSLGLGYCIAAIAAYNFLPVHSEQSEFQRKFALPMDISSSICWWRTILKKSLWVCGLRCAKEVVRAKAWEMLRWIEDSWWS
jgi:hypothetical protein